MPDIEKDHAIEVEEDGTVTIDVTDIPELAGDEATVTEAEPQVAAPKPAAPRQRQVKTEAPPEIDEASLALSQAVKTAEEARKAAEATAERERQGREAAQREAKERAEEARAAREEASGHELTIITTGLEQAKQRQEASAREWQRAMEAGDYVLASKAQTEGQTAAAQLVQLEDAKARFEMAPKKPTTEGRVEAPAPSAPVERFIANNNFSLRSQSWLRAHPDCIPSEFGGNGQKNDLMMEAHFAAKAKGIPLESDEYFKMIEERTGFRQVETPVSQAAAVTSAEPAAIAAPKPRKAAPVSAPVSRDTPVAAGARLTRTVVLTPLQREAAKISGVSEAVYARNLLELEAEGKGPGMRSGI